MSPFFAHDSINILNKRAKAKLLTFIRLVDLVQAVVAEAGIYPPGAKNRQSEGTRNVARGLEFPAIIARVCEKNWVSH